MKRFALAILLAAFILVPQGAFSYSVMPAIIDLESELAGQTYGEFSVINSNDVDETVYLSTKAFSATEQAGVPEFYETDNENEFANWIAFESSSYVIAAHSKVSIPFAATIPKTVPSGGYYAAIMVSQAPSEVVATNGATIHATIAILCFLTVQGDSVESMQILTIDSDFEGIRSSLFGDVDVTVQNQGTIHLVPEGEISITDLFGRSLQVADINSTNGRVLPASKRTFSVNFSDETNGYWSKVMSQAGMLAMGPMKVSSKVVYGSEQVEIHDTQGFWYIPWQLLSFLFLVVVCLSLFYRLFFKLHLRKIEKLSN